MKQIFRHKCQVAIRFWFTPLVASFALATTQAAWASSVASEQKPVKQTSTELHWQQSVLGQSFQLTLAGISAADFAQHLPKLQQQLLLLQHSLDGTATTSAISRFNQSGHTTDPHLLKLLQLCEHWWQQTQAYSCRLGHIRQQWHQAEQQAQLPDRVLLRQQVRQLQRLDSTAVQTQLQQQASGSKPAAWLQIDSSGLAAAVLLDQLLPQIQQWWPTAQQWRLQLAGITLVGGDAMTYQLQLGPKPTASPLTKLRLQQQALAYSYDLQPGAQPFHLSHRQWSPLLSPTDGWPLDYAPQVAAVAHTAAHAWLLAQSLAATAIPKQQELLNKVFTLTGAKQNAALLQPAQGPLLASEHWYRLLAEPALQQSQLSLQLDYQLPDHGPGSKNPYLSIWLSDAQHQRIRQLKLHGEQQRWLPELRSWWSLQRKNPLDLDSISGATRKSGRYQLQWDGRDQQGQPLKPGRYTLVLEAAREHGGYEKLKIELDWQANAQGQLSGSKEMGLVRWQVTTNAKTQLDASTTLSRLPLEAPLAH
jgi:thiamine biosynthesis lipoprotein